ncbi:ABC transporter substrate-binding protein [Sulfitobacter mediterraneus]|nr:ABC transporter substrate-binding protein [Sulfitobacter mediterraneus]MBM1635176.1 ABC transporter substrate-binding protein [Sulfitobacter mediterraneus]MBM1643027.1 ABC transporter substrate-binding protein [Sulfitobacter mediterraneus]MBM1647075.1 ABC transporter substrate-binding protein [Sulfitobacter mediterraneus]MBM1651117.1 ABC transporter substrate-binding protein [Sulfitobacter mediterraneus]MBM1655156.1 ABC transporter substrate-binding protein [Sulfitobacter mediterraneus]
MSGTVASAQDTIRIASPNKVTVLDPIVSAAAGNIEAYGQLYARLLRRDADGMLQPGLAESYEMSEDGLTYTFELREAKFSDGTTITAEDAAFSLNRVSKDENSAYPAGFAPVKEFVAIDEDTLQLTLEHPSAPMLSNLEIFNAGIVSKDDVTERGENAFAEKPVSSGPYMVKEWKPNDRLLLTANPHYWRAGLPKIKNVELIEVSDDNARATMLMAGEIDVNRGVPWAQIDEVNESQGATVNLEPSTVLYVVLPNHTKPPFDNLAVRRAAAMALNREAMTKAVTLGHANVANSTLSNALTYYDKNVSPPSYDPAAARKLLDDEGLVGTEITMMITPSAEQVATLLKAQWDAVGFKTTVERVDAGLWWSKLADADYQVTTSWYYNETEDPDLAVRWALCGACGSNSYYTRYNNEEVNKLTDEALRETDEEKRAELYRRIQEISVEELSQIPLYYSPFSNGYSNRVKGLKLTPALQWTLEEAELTDG